MFSSIQQKIYELNLKERELFVPVANELIDNGYFTYEGGTLQCLRLMEIVSSIRNQVCTNAATT